jgi:leader peptidase (prepilin peptidase) / N-methyltransferase
MLLEYLAVMIFGVLIGNFTTTMLYRLPRNITICGMNKCDDQPPFCSHCHHKLKFYEYLPVLSWVSSKGFCNYCKQKLPIQYFILEIGAIFLSCYCFYMFDGITDFYVLLFLFGISCLLTILIYHEHGDVPKIILMFMLLLGIIYRTLLEQTMMNWLSSLSLGFVLSLFLINGKFFKINKHWIGTLILASVWCMQNDLALYAIIISALCILRLFSKQLDLYPLSIIALFWLVLSDATLFLSQA